MGHGLFYIRTNRAAAFFIRRPRRPNRAAASAHKAEEAEENLGSAFGLEAEPRPTAFYGSAQTSRNCGIENPKIKNLESKR